MTASERLTRGGWRVRSPVAAEQGRIGAVERGDDARLLSCGGSMDWARIAAVA